MLGSRSSGGQWYAGTGVASRIRPGAMVRTLARNSTRRNRKPFESSLKTNSTRYWQASSRPKMRPKHPPRSPHLAPVAQNEPVREPESRAWQDAFSRAFRRLLQALGYFCGAAPASLASNLRACRSPLRASWEVWAFVSVSSRSAALAAPLIATVSTGVLAGDGDCAGGGFRTRGLELCHRFVWNSLRQTLNGNCH